ncbi:MAG TPA: glycerophosphodiester phosphodiesterase [Solirubrobacteraceae bacterium]|nr:glycerophosphodiester phosphodiesterase [Solirubrobacteraceae bacterium]
MALVIAHRGASGYRPEHTLAAYALGARMGADYIEPDLVSTKDGVLVARHENEISGTTDVAERPEFAGRRATKTIDGVALTGWFTEDFTLAELKTLRAKERIPQLRPRNTLYDGRYEVPTFQEVVDLAERLSRDLRREIGIYPETKHPTYFRQIGLPLEEPLVTALRRNDLDGRRDKVFVQSFEASSLRRVRKSVDVPLVQLLTAAADLEEIATYADAVGPPKHLIVPRDDDGRSLEPTSFVRDAHRADLLVHPYTFRNENSFLPLELRSSADPAAYGRAFGEYEQFYALGVDGLFSDNPDTAVEARATRR